MSLACLSHQFPAAPAAVVTLLALMTPAAARGAGPAPESARHAAAVEGILAAWKTHDLVCLGEDHGRKHDSDLRIALVSHPRFAATVDVVIVEFATPIHQDLLDRFILEGEDLAHEELAPVWRDTTAPRVWESPIYADFLRAVRAANLRAPAADRVRVVGGEVPIDWQEATTGEDLLPLLGRGDYPIEIVEREVFAANRKGLAIYGSGHCDRRRGFTAAVAERHPGKVWSAFGFWTAEAVEQGRRLFDLGDLPRLVGVAGAEAASLPAGTMFPVPGSGPPGTLADVLDAIVYHGAVEDVVIHPPEDPFPEAFSLELERRGRLQAEFAEIFRRRFSHLEDED